MSIWILIIASCIVGGLLYLIHTLLDERRDNTTTIQDLEETVQALSQGLDEVIEANEQTYLSLADYRMKAVEKAYQYQELRRSTDERVHELEIETQHLEAEVQKLELIVQDHEEHCLPRVKL